MACRACNTNKGDYDNPACRLLDPHVDDVETIVVFVGKLAHAECGRRAAKTIKRLKLNRSGLVWTRKRVLEDLGQILDRLEDFTNIQALVDQLWCEVERLTATEGKFASTSRQMLEQQLEERGLAGSLNSSSSVAYRSGGTSSSTTVIVSRLLRSSSLT